MENYQIIAISLILLFSCGFFWIIYSRFYRKAVMDENRYFLYKKRDDLIYLIARGDLNENEFLYSDTIEKLNNLVNNVHHFNLKNTVRAMARDQSDVTTEEYRKRLLEDISNHNPNVKRFFNEFFETMAIILMRNSLLLRIIFRSTYILALTSKFIKKYSDFIKKTFLLRTQVEAYQYVELCNSFKIR